MYDLCRIAKLLVSLNLFYINSWTTYFTLSQQHVGFGALELFDRCKYLHLTLNLLELLRELFISVACSKIYMGLLRKRVLNATATK